MMRSCSSVLIILSWVFVLSFRCEAGFSGGFAKKKQNSGPARKKSKKKPVQKDAVTLQTIDLGGGHTVEIYVPPNRLEDGIASGAPGSKRMKIGDPKQFLKDIYGAGDVIWPSSIHLARLVANCPSFVGSKRVIDIGCGLGLASAAALLGKPKSITVSDLDENVMDLSIATLENMNSDDDVELNKCRIDWLKKETWPEAAENGSTYDLVLASDVLFNEDSIGPFAELVAHCLIAEVEIEQQESSSRALIVDPVNRPHRDRFVKCCETLGLAALPVPFPGQEKDFVLINVLPVD